MHGSSGAWGWRRPPATLPDCPAPLLLNTQGGEMTESEANSQPLDSQCEKKFKLIDFLTQRLEHTIGHTQTATKLIYLLNGAVLAAVYFELGKVQPISAAFMVAAFLTFLLSIINFLHANFLATHWTVVSSPGILRSHLLSA